MANNSNKCLVLGDVMLDFYTYGYVNRVNPEAPTLVLESRYNKFTLGGAGNVVKNLVGLGMLPSLISVIGNDSEGEKIKKLLKKLGIRFFLFSDGRPSIVKHRFIALGYNQQLLRVDRESTDAIKLNLCKKIAAKVIDINPDILLISDYGKGLITKSLMKFIREKYNGKIIVDPKPKNIELYKGVYLIKPNLRETMEVLGRDIKNEDKDIEKAGRELVDMFEANFVITRGEKGATLIDTHKNVFHFRSDVKEVHDVSGAGDTFIATLCFGIEQGYNLRDCVNIANKAAGIVVGKFGTVAIKREEINKILYNKA